MCSPTRRRRCSPMADSTEWESFSATRRTNVCRAAPCLPISGKPSSRRTVPLRCGRNRSTRRRCVLQRTCGAVGHRYLVSLRGSRSTHLARCGGKPGVRIRIRSRPARERESRRDARLRDCARLRDPAARWPVRHRAASQATTLDLELSDVMQQYWASSRKPEIPMGVLGQPDRRATRLRDNTCTLPTVDQSPSKGYDGHTANCSSST
jgi:hypothetical protein